jgi:hypothetical protein
LKLPAHVLFRKELSLILWKPRGVLDESLVNEIVVFIDTAEARASKPFNRFADLSALDAVDLNFNFVFHVALHRRLAYAPKPPVKSAFYVTSPATTHYAKLHAMLTDRLFAARRGPVHGSRRSCEMARRSGGSTDLRK